MERLFNDPLSDNSINIENFYNKILLLVRFDLARVPYKEVLKRSSAAKVLIDSNKRPQEHSDLEQKFREIGLWDIDALFDFLNESKAIRLAYVKEEERENEQIHPYLLPTRPYTPLEIAELVPSCVRRIVESKKTPPEVTWARFVRALRGVWVKPPLLDKVENKEKKFSSGTDVIYLGSGKTDEVIVAITNLLTSDDMWEASASGNSKLTLDRYKRISDLVNKAIRLRPRPDYLLLPELSLPHEWVYSVGTRLNSAGINLIAGTEYKHLGDSSIVSHACLQLIDDRMGFPASVRIWQEKSCPAPREERDLIAHFGKNWKVSSAQKSKNQKPIYCHNGFCFGIMVCSELQNSKARVNFQGKVDALMVLAWNRDLDTFSALVESAALDVHAYILLVNNRKYGDSRVRSPAKQDHYRDLARVRGGENDFCVNVKINIKALRTFQKRAKRWPEDDDIFKPVPKGFELDERWRKT